MKTDGERGGSKREREGERDNMKRMGMALQSKFKEETFSCLSQTGEGFSLNLTFSFERDTVCPRTPCEGHADEVPS